MSDVEVVNLAAASLVFTRFLVQFYQEKQPRQPTFVIFVFQQLLYLFEAEQQRFAYLYQFSLLGYYHTDKFIAVSVLPLACFEKIG